jgi:hypothetical protein
MALERPLCTIRVALGINVQHDTGDLAPVGAIVVRVEQAQLGHEVFFVVRR